MNNYINIVPNECYCYLCCVAACMETLRMHTICYLCLSSFGAKRELHVYMWLLCVHYEDYTTANLVFSCTLNTNF